MSSHFFYANQSEPFTGGIPLDRLNKNTQFNKHLAILYELRFIAANPLATFQERHQANKEILIAEKKMKYWSRFKDFDEKATVEENTRLRKLWSERPAKKDA